MSAKVTIGIPFYNVETTLVETIRSVFSQSEADWRMILLDDGSTDRSLQIAGSIRDDRVSVVSDGDHRGIGARRKEIVGMVQTEYLAWQDADDLMHPERLALQLAFVHDHPECDLVDSWTYHIDCDGSILAVQRLPEIRRDLGAVLAGPIMINAACLGRTQLFAKHPFDPSLKRSEDWDMWIRAFPESQFDRIPQPLYLRRVLDADGKVFWRKALSELANSRKIVLNYGPRMVGWTKTLRILSENHARAYARAALTASGLQSLLPRNRDQTQRITEQERTEGEAAVAAIRATPVPGLD